MQNSGQKAAENWRTQDSGENARTQARMQYLEGDDARVVGVDLVKSHQRLFAVNLGRMMSAHVCIVLTQEGLLRTSISSSLRAC